MKSGIEKRLAQLEQAKQESEQRITRVLIMCGKTGEIGGVIHIGGEPDQKGVIDALRFKHETDPPRQLRCTEDNRP